MRAGFFPYSRRGRSIIRLGAVLGLFAVGLMVAHPLLHPHVAGHDSCRATLHPAHQDHDHEHDCDHAHVERHPVPADDDAPLHEDGQDCPWCATHRSTPAFALTATPALAGVGIVADRPLPRDEVAQWALILIDGRSQRGPPAFLLS